MATSPISLDLDDREEGEIVDDDFEDISDNSMNVTFCHGKSVSNKDHLPAISLSSISESDDHKKIKRRAKPVRRKSIKKRKRVSKVLISTDSDSDEQFALDRKLQKQLKAAIRVDSEECRHNSLRSRLRGMTQIDNNVEEKQNQKSETEHINDNFIDEVDSELTELRLEALRTAFLNKVKHRKKKNVEAHESEVFMETDTLEINCNVGNLDENTEVSNDIPNKKICLEFDDNIENNSAKENTQEDDEDVLRALLLASISKKMTEDTNIKSTISHQEKKLGALGARLNLKENVIEKKHVYNIAHGRPIQLPKVKPIIINVNGDSDTEDDSLINKINGSSKTNMCNGQLYIENTVNKFLNEERTKIEAQNMTVLKPKQVNVKDSLQHEKSSLKLLSKKKQIEYQKLMQQLRMAEKRKRRTSHKIIHKGPTQIVKQPVKKIGNRVLINKPAALTKKDSVSNLKFASGLFHKTFKELQVTKNGRLHFQKKYANLAPIVRKINEKSLEGKTYEQEIKRLLEELTSTRKKLHATHQTFIYHVNELVSKKQEIDKAFSEKIPFTSTPIKSSTAIEPVNTNSMSVPLRNQSIIDSNMEKMGSNDLCTVSDKTNQNEQKELGKGERNSLAANIMGTTCKEQKSSIRKYISPLESVNKVNIEDPFSIMCPFDIDGNCCDPDCIFKHYK